jgi:RNA polymerase sigma-70 factor, ECF subfamily
MSEGTTSAVIEQSFSESDSEQLELRLEQHRTELTAHCYRMLGATFEAEDAVQETMVRAWLSLDRFEGRAGLRSWLYRIASNVCLDMLNDGRRRARPMDLGPSLDAEALVDAPQHETTLIQPASCGALPTNGDPAELTVTRENIRLAFIAALQRLPAKQRAVLILREVLRWKADEVAELLGTTVASVNSALQRARSTLAAGEAVGETAPRLDEAQRALLARYVDAFERYDLASLIDAACEPN